MMPLPIRRFTVNRTDDPTPVSPITNACNGVANDCSFVRRFSGPISAARHGHRHGAAGTYTLTLARVANDCTWQSRRFVCK